MAEEELKLNDRLAVSRTVMAADRTLMAWVRTALSLISFGFTIYKILQQMIMMDSRAETASLRLMRAQGPRNLGLLLMALGTYVVVMGMIQHWGAMRSLGRAPRDILTSAGVTLAAAIALLGLLLFSTILANAELF